MTSSQRITRNFTKEFKLNAAKLVLEERMSVAKAVQDLGLSVSTLHGWVRQFRNGTWELIGEGSSTLKPDRKLILATKKQSLDKQKIQDLERQLKRMTIAGYI